MGTPSIRRKFSPATKCEYYVNRTDNVNYFLNSIKQYRVMTPEEEYKTMQEYKKTKDLSKRNLLVSCNQRYVYALAKRLSTDSETIIDLVNEGNIGLINAIEKYDLSYGDTHRNSLMIYASSYVMRNMINYFLMDKTVSRRSDLKMGNRLSNEKNAFFAKNGRFPSDDELREIFIEKYGKTFKDNCPVEQMVTISIDDNTYYDDMDFSGSEEFNSRTSSVNEYMETIENDAVKQQTDFALNNLSKRDRDIVEKLFGLTGVEYSPSDIAEMYGLTKTRVMQIRKNALEVMKYSLERA